MATKSELQDLIGLFPEMEFAMAYGSVAFEQKHHNSSNSMLDLVFAVKDPTKWHAENLQRFPHHYSALKYLGAENISSIQQNYGAGLYYNTLVRFSCFNFEFCLIAVDFRAAVRSADQIRSYINSTALSRPVALAILVYKWKDAQTGKWVRGCRINCCIQSF